MKDPGTTELGPFLHQCQHHRLDEHVGHALAERRLRFTTDVVFGRDRFGSGIYVCTRAGTLAVLTATHVVLGVLVRGGTVQIVGRDGKGCSASRIRLASECDAALVWCPAAPKEALPADDWSPSRARRPEFDELLVALGTPGEWEGFEPPSTITVKRLALWGAVKQVEHPLMMHIDEEKSPLPKSLGGMSGGPVFGYDDQLLGLAARERRRIDGGQTGELIVADRAAWSDLHSEGTEDERLPTGLEFGTSIHVQHKKKEYWLDDPAELFLRGTSSGDGGAVTEVLFGESQERNVEACVPFVSGDGGAERAARQAFARFVECFSSFERVFDGD